MVYQEPDTSLGQHVDEVKVESVMEESGNAYETDSDGEGGGESRSMVKIAIKRVVMREGSGDEDDVKLEKPEFKKRKFGSGANRRKK